MSLVGVEYGGWALLGFLTGRGQLGEFREQFFRAGRAHAGMLLVLSLVYFLYFDRRGAQRGYSGSRACSCSWESSPSRVVSSFISRGQKNRSSVGTIVTRTGALLLAAALIILAIGLL